VPEDHGQNAAPRGAKRHSHTDVTRALREVVGEQAVETDTRQHQGEGCEPAQHAHLHAPRCCFTRDDIRKRLNVRHRLLPGWPTAR
jgi:hypothetical protein